MNWVSCYFISPFVLFFFLFGTVLEIKMSLFFIREANIIMISLGNVEHTHNEINNYAFKRFFMKSFSIQKALKTF